MSLQWTLSIALVLAMGSLLDLGQHTKEGDSQVPRPELDLLVTAEDFPLEAEWILLNITLGEGDGAIHHSLTRDVSSPDAPALMNQCMIMNVNGGMGAMVYREGSIAVVSSSSEAPDVLVGDPTSVPFVKTGTWSLGHLDQVESITVFVAVEGIGRLDEIGGTFKMTLPENTLAWQIVDHGPLTCEGGFESFDRGTYLRTADVGRADGLELDMSTDESLVGFVLAHADLGYEWTLEGPGRDIGQEWSPLGPEVDPWYFLAEPQGGEWMLRLDTMTHAEAYQIAYAFADIPLWAVTIFPQGTLENPDALTPSLGCRAAAALSPLVCGP